VKQGTIEHFKRWSRGLVRDDGEELRLERWQFEIVRDILEARTTWIVIPQGNGKTTLMAAVGLYHLDPLGWGVHRPMVVVAAATRDQATWLYAQASGFVRDSDSMRGRFVCQEGFRRIKLPEDDDDDPRGRLQIWAADDKNADGAIFTLGIIDELHNHKDLRLYRRWRGKLRKRDAQLVAISTAGAPGTDFEETRAKIIREASRRRTRGSHTRVEADQIVLHDWQLKDRRLKDDMRAVKQANPLSKITIPELRQDRADPSMTDPHWLRFTCNIAAREEGQAVDPEVWDALAEPDVQPTGWCLGFVDVGFEIDCTAMGVLYWEAFERRVVTGVKILEPPVDEADIASGLIELQREHQPEAFVFDPNAGARQMAQQLEKGEHHLQQDGAPAMQFIEHSQDNAPMSLAVRADEAVR
jgi:phage terminase large subunit-like protein